MRYGYLAAQRIDEIGAENGRDVDWRPFLLGAVFKTTGAQPLLDIPLKGDYARRDLARSARLMDIPFSVPKQFPFMSHRYAFISVRLGIDCCISRISRGIPGNGQAN